MGVVWNDYFGKIAFSAVGEEVLQGTVVAPWGDGGFGWDALFQPNGSDRTLGECTRVEKNAVSIRAQEFEKLCAHILRSS